MIDKKTNPTILSPREDEILKILKKKGKLSAKEIHSYLKQNLSERLLRAELLKLKKNGFITTVGKGKSTIWTLI